LYKDHTVFGFRKNTASRGFFGMSFHISLHGCHGIGSKAAERALHTGLHRSAVASSLSLTPEPRTLAPETQATLRACIRVPAYLRKTGGEKRIGKCS
jgi:hypothetical protein